MQEDGTEKEKESQARIKKELENISLAHFAEEQACNEALPGRSSAYQDGLYQPLENANSFNLEIVNKGNWIDDYLQGSIDRFQTDKELQRKQEEAGKEEEPDGESYLSEYTWLDKFKHAMKETDELIGGVASGFNDTIGTLWLDSALAKKTREELGLTSSDWQQLIQDVALGRAELVYQNEGYGPRGVAKKKVVGYKYLDTSPYTFSEKAAIATGNLAGMAVLYQTGVLALKGIPAWNRAAAGVGRYINLVSNGKI